MKSKHILSYMVFLAFSVAVFAPSHSYADNAIKYPSKGDVAKAKVSSVDQLFVCTASVPYIYVNARIPYAPAKNAIVKAPIKLVEAVSNSPPVNR